MSIVLSGCVGFTQTLPPIVNDNYCSLTQELPKSQAVERDIRMMSIELFKYIETSATTKKCECFETQKEQEACWQEYANLR
jgi:hypothetical protein